MSKTDALLENNRRYAATFNAPGKPTDAAPTIAVLTCMDARLHPERFLGLEIGEAHVIRNAGGRASDDALRSLIISSQLLGTSEYLVIHHTDCGMLRLSNDEVRTKLAAVTGADASHIDFLGFTDVTESVRDDVRRIRHNPLIPVEIPISGYIYEVDTGVLTPVVGATA